ncbi:unnamed protein product, partial [Schistosoma margrebowiei]
SYQFRQIAYSLHFNACFLSTGSKPVGKKSNIKAKKMKKMLIDIKRSTVKKCMHFLYITARFNTLPFLYVNRII